MDRTEAISKCRYYNGETECPFKTNQLFLYWDLERSWVQNAHGELDEENDALYRAYDGKDYPGAPRALLIWMFAAYMKQSFDIKRSIPKFYVFMDEYLEAASDYIPPDKIPSDTE